MPASGVTKANENRRIRREALREQLTAQGHVQHVTEIVDKLLDLSEDLDNVQVQRLSKAIDAKFKLIGKYLPDVKQVEITDEDGNSPFPQSISINVIKPVDSDT